MRGAFMTPIKTFRGYSYPLGATWTGDGVNFAIFSQHATGVELCLFDSVNNTEDNVRIPLKERTGHVWHVFLPDARPSNCAVRPRAWVASSPSTTSRYLA